MAEKYNYQKNPFIVPTNDGKLIEEHFGEASIKSGDYSIAHMIAPPGWEEPFQTPEFDEITYLIRGKKKFEIDGEEIFLKANESILVKKGTRVRYSNPFDTECEYLSFCIPAFSIERVNRE
ncbi:MAG: cupin domain-containing protein [Melioribacteraceae bacterium]|nr:cupin domain-containing protein [Melioribacteraceae bacterium]MCF8264893.1 cupin domain-containing protein [Melioribacteraceae bacterium]MCF8432478.1 cupin domain-containing protein [Melioribacteraceae bacterium]